MGLYRTIDIADGVRAYIWKIEESEADLAQGITLTPHCQTRYEGMLSEVHRKGFLSIRHLFAKAGYTDNDVFYDDFGKPHLKDGRFISITHALNYTGIIVSDTVEVGIDIERQREKILKIAHKFTPIKEYRTLANSDALIRKLTMVWGIKESLYKICGIKGLSFLKHMNVHDFSLSKDNESTAVVRHQGEEYDFQVHFFEFDGYTCAYALKEAG